MNKIIQFTGYNIKHIQIWEDWSGWIDDTRLGYLRRFWMESNNWWDSINNMWNNGDISERTIRLCI